MYEETKKRTLTKTMFWRMIATLNSYAILCIGLNNNLKSAIIMNISGFFLYYIFERTFNKIKWGKIKK
jgi:hypothetical protein